MVKVIMALKGSGKTKRLVELVKAAVDEESGYVVCIEKDKNLTYDIPYQVRLIHASDYQFGANDFFRGFISGIYAGNYDITHIFIDNFFKIIESDDWDKTSELLDWLASFSEKENVNFTVSATADPSEAPERVKKYFIN